MLHRDPKCVFVADDHASAAMIAGLLEGAGFPAQIQNEAMHGGFEGLTALAPGVSHRGLEVWVTDPDKLEEAKTWLEAEMKSAAAARDARKERTGTVVAACEECGKSSEWPASEMGRTETCPHCEAYLDIPDPDDDWDEDRLGDAEDEKAVEE